MSDKTVMATKSNPNVGRRVMRNEVLAARHIVVVTIFYLTCIPLSLAQEVRPNIAVHIAAFLSPLNRANADLPDSPGAMRAMSTSMTTGLGAVGANPALGADSMPEASPSDKYIAPGQVAPRLRIRDKALLGLKDAGSATTVLAAVVAAGISHIDNSSPNYGTDGDAFAERFGAAMARGGSYSVFSDSVLASVLREDPRYYRMGRGHRFIKRLTYAVTRPLITRTDAGKATPNFSLCGGHMGAAYLTQTYYPSRNTSTSDVLETFGLSFVGSAIDYSVNEFLPGSLNFLHNSQKADR